MNTRRLNPLGTPVGEGVRAGPRSRFQCGARSPAAFALVLLTLLRIGSDGSPLIADEPGLRHEPFRVRTWGLENGLPLSHVAMMTQSRDGYLWMGAAHEGLFRFDGVRFSATGSDRVSPRAYSGDKELSALVASRDGSLWVGTPHGLWRNRGDQWEQFNIGLSSSDHTITALGEAKNGDIWTGSPTGVNRVRGNMVRAFTTKDGLSGKPISAIMGDRIGNVWVGTIAGELYCLRDERVSPIAEIPNTATNPINAIVEGEDGSVWVGMWGNGLGRFKEGAWRIYGRDFGEKDQEILALAEDRWGSIWLGTRKGLYLLPGASQGGGRINETPIAYGTTYRLLKDREGTIWAGTISGLHQYKDWRLRVYGEEEGFPDRNISAIVPAREGGLWVGTYAGGLVRFHDGHVTDVYSVAHGLSSNAVTSICETGDGTLLVGTWGHGMNRLKDGKFMPFHGPGRSTAEVIRSIYEDRAGDLWYGTWGEGLRRLHGGLGTTYTTSDGLGSNQVRVIEEDRQGNLWIATNGGLSQFRAGKWKTYRTQDGLSEDSIFALHAGTDGALWIGTWGGGLSRFHDDRFTSYTTREGLPCDTICQILEDQEDNLWISSLKGIFRVRKSDLDAFDRRTVTTIASTLYDTNDGMRSAQCNRGTQPSGCRTANGRLWFATINGMVLIDPHLLPAPPNTPTAIVEKVLHDGQTDVESPGDLWLPSFTKDIEIQYTAASFLNAEKTRFSYKLDGYDDDWVIADSRREARYSNVPPGSHTFKVRVANGEGGWGPASNPVRISIHPPLYRTPWFLAACASAALVGAVLAYRVRTARRLARERELMVLVQRRTAEARAAQDFAEQANRAKNRFLAVLSHELRTPLTPVLLSVGSLLDEHLPPEAREQLDMIRRNIELEARLVDDLLDVSRIERGHLKLDLELVDVHQAIRRALEICDDEVRRSGLELILNLSAEEHHAHADYARLIQLFWNLIRNAVKFNSPSGTLTIRSRVDRVSAGHGGPRLIVEFQDTGVGIEPHVLGRIFDPFEQGSDLPRDRRGGLGLGLAICRGVAEAHGARLTAESAGKGHGSTFRLELATSPPPAKRPTESPCHGDSRRLPAGLRVLLVEDNVDTLRYLGIILGRRGHAVTIAATLRAAREAIAADTFDLLISDIELPDGTGLDLMRELSVQGVPGIALSGYGSTDDVQLSREAGFATHLIKPIVADTLDAAIGRVVKPTAGVQSELSDGQGASLSNGTVVHRAELSRQSSPTT